MNEHLVTGPHGLRLLMDFEKGDKDVRCTPNGAALEPYVCPGDELTIGYGCCTWFDGSPVQIHHRLKDEDHARALLAYNLKPYEDAVRKAMKREATQHQFDGHVALCFNIGIGAYTEPCSALRTFNEGRLEDSAANFGLWTGSTTARPRKEHIENPEFADKLIKDHKGLWRWKGPDGQYCRYMLRYEGLLNRHYAEALLTMGRDWERTIRSKERLELVLVPTPPGEARYNPLKGRWQDEVKFRTPFKDVLAHAYDDRLTDATVTIILDVSTPNAKPIIAETLPTFEEELILDQPAVSASDASGAAPDAAPSLAPASSVIEKQNTGVSPPVSPAPVNQLPPSPPGPVSPIPGPAPPKPPPIIAPKSIDIKSIPYGEVDPSNGAKNMTDSTRFVGMLIVAGGSLVQVLAAREVVSSTAGAIFFDLSRDPVIVALIAGGVIWAVGSVTKMWGRKVITKGMVEAKEVLK